MNTPAGLRFREDVLERFIPVSINELADDLTAAAPADDAAILARFCRQFILCTHARFYTRLNDLKSAYLPFSPDPDLVTARVYETVQLQQQQEVFLREIRTLLDQANFEELSHRELEQALDKDSHYGIRVAVDFADFDHVVLFYRGTAVRTDVRPDWRRLGLRQVREDVPVYRRLFVLVKLKNPDRRRAEFAHLKGPARWRMEWRLRQTWQKLPQETRADCIYLKLFKDVPAVDLEMLFPTVRVRMKWFDKLKLSITSGGGTLGGLFATVGKLGAALSPYAMATALIGFVGLVARQVSKIFHQRTKYMMALAQQLYFHNLSNNQGAITYLMDLAKDEENKEALLAYYFLHFGPARPYTEAELDRAVEAWIREHYRIAVDFEVPDGLQKLRKTGLLHEDEHGRLSVEPPAAACQRLQALWGALLQI